MYVHIHYDHVDDQFPRLRAVSLSHARCTMASETTLSDVAILDQAQLSYRSSTHRDRPRALALSACIAMSLLDHITTGLRNAETLVSAQIASGVARGDALHAMCNNFMGQLSMIGPITEANLATFSEVIDAGPWEDDQRDTLIGAAQSITDFARLSTRLVGKTRARPLQKCWHFENFLTNADYALIQTQTAERAVQCTLAQRASSIGIHNACEHTLNRMVRILASLMRWEWCTQHRVNTCKTDIQKCIKQRAVDPRLPYLTLYDHTVFLWRSLIVIPRPINRVTVIMLVGSLV